MRLEVMAFSYKITLQDFNRVLSLAIKSLSSLRFSDQLCNYPVKCAERCSGDVMSKEKPVSSVILPLFCQFSVSTFRISYQARNCPLAMHATYINIRLGTQHLDATRILIWPRISKGRLES